MRTNILVRQKGRKITINERIKKAIDIELISIYKNFFPRLFKMLCLFQIQLFLFVHLKNRLNSMPKRVLKTTPKKSTRLPPAPGCAYLFFYNQYSLSRHPGRLSAKHRVVSTNLI